MMSIVSVVTFNNLKFVSFYRNIFYLTCSFIELFLYHFAFYVCSMFFDFQRMQIVSELMHGCIHTCMTEWMKEWMNAYMNDWMNERMNGWVSEQMNERMDEWMHACMNY